MNGIKTILTITLLTSLPAFCQGATSELKVKAVNTLEIARPSQTIELSAQQLAPLGEKDLRKIHVKDAAGKELLCQAVDTDGDYHPDEVIFQADFATGATNSFTVTVGKKWDYTKDQFKAYGRFVRERFDDFAWENDRIAHRTYGKALETWKEEPLTSSAIDVWTKRVSSLVINGWYMLDNYHLDHGEGADFYSAGSTRGNGGDGLWAGDKLWVSKNFVDARVLACGPIRVMFELTYEPFDVNGTKVSEVRRISLDAGQNLDHYQVTYKPERSTALTVGIGVKKKDVTQTDAKISRCSLTTWEQLRDDKLGGSHLGQAIVLDPKLLVKTAEDNLNYLVLAKASRDNSISYWAGFGWDKSGQFADYDSWKAYADEFARGALSPIEVTVSAN
ncbi:MAG TPA: DUF4861 family protein [Verrucomicrobiae bacterium]|nr:DUF4861 family protein [Verrucomicrobiae bacterium]